MRRASKSWRSVWRLSHFGLVCEIRVYEWERNDVSSRATYTEELKEPQGSHLTSWFAHAMRCSCGCVLTCMASWDSIALLAGRTDACGKWEYIYVCVVCYRRFASLASIASWRGCPMQSNAIVELPFDRHKAVMDITFAAWCEVNIEFVEWLLCEAVGVMFCLWYVRKNIKRYVRKHVKRYVRKNVRRYVRKNIKRYVRKNVRRHIKIYVKKEFKRYVRKNFRRYAKKNVKTYIRKNIRRFVILRCVFMIEAGSEELKWCFGDNCGNIDACLM